MVFCLDRSPTLWKAAKGAGGSVMSGSSEQATKILDAVGAGDEQAAERLLPLVYDELRHLAAAKLAHEAPGQTLQPTALVHEAWLRLVGPGHDHWNSRGHFFGAAAEAMRRILIDRARKRHRQRHGHGMVRVDFSQLDIAITTDDDLLLRVNEALEKLESEAPERAQLVKLRFFTGLSITEAAEAMGVATATANRHWAFARAWLLAELQNAS
ncbi:MAG TPA: sigma-70 family RNA polymerase sigma factor [Verrucomicrobiae bacterium]|nr:sigma-70 family RNA polymerase sigma factor [Verrucomicrobiae bacterium]